MPEGSRKASPKRPTLFAEDYLLYLLARASAQVSDQFHAVVKAKGINVLEWRVLAATSDARRSIGELADMTLAQQPTLTKVIDRMARDGWVMRVRDAQDGRRVWVEITDKGSAMVRDLLAEAKQHEDRVLAGYSAAEADALKETLRTLIERTAG
jgi:DNA-binding MarR family transcriptional regulator